jgi:hypothetical protein
MIWFDEDDENVTHEAGDTQECDVCGGEQEWCSSCQVFTNTCHEPWGSCACS